MAKSTHASVKSRHGDLTVQQHETDSPIIPVQQIEQLHQFRPDRVDWLFEQTQAEAEYRRLETHRVNTFVFIERLIGQICALLIGLSGHGGKRTTGSGRYDCRACHYGFGCGVFDRT